MTITLFQIDKSGSDIFEKDYSIVLIVNKEIAYGINIPQKVKDELINLYKRGRLNILSSSEKKQKNRFRLRFHTAIIIKLIERAIYDLKQIDKTSFQICNDFDGHFNEIKDMVFKNISKKLTNLELEDILQTKFQKPSKIDEIGKAFREKKKEILKDCTSVKIETKDLMELIKK